MAFGPVLELSTLDGTNGFQLSGGARYDRSGFSVASARDVNGDGFDDIIVGAYGADPNGSLSGASYVVFGKAGDFRANLNLSNLNGANRFQINGEASTDLFGYSVSSAGDVNGDGFDDIIVGAPAADPNDTYSGASYVLLGKAGGFEANVNVSRLNGSTGFQISGEASGYRIGSAVSSAGDVNGDGFGDIIVGAERAGHAGESYVVFGKAGGFAANLDLATLDGANGFQLSGKSRGDRSGISVSSAGDVNGDGFSDIIVGASGANRPNAYDSGASYVVFGKAGGFEANLDLSTLDGENGFRISGEAPYDASGISVASAGDVNGDGLDDIIVGARNADSGVRYVVFGREGGFGANLNLSTLNGANGFQISREAALGEIGSSVSSAGDFNGDGFDDLIVGAKGAGPNGSGSGASYVVFGKASNFTANVDLSTLDGENGFQIRGEAEFDESGTSISSAGDINRDGFDDLVVGAPGASPNGTSSGATYVIFGQATGPINRTGTGANDLLRGGAFGDTLDGKGGDDRLAGGDGDDRLIGGPGRDRLGGGSGDDSLTGGGGDDRLSGGAGNDRLFGERGADTLAGGRGDDRLSGGAGADVLFGGPGADIFVFARAGESPADGSDTLLDFRSGQDCIDLSGIDADPGLGGDGVFAFRGGSAFTGAGGEVRTAVVAGDTRVLADLDGDRQADLRIVLDGVVALAAEDFLL